MMRVYQLETTNYCNAVCNYCPHKQMTRDQGYVSYKVVEKVIELCKKNNQHYIALHHMGEPLLHPHIHDIIVAFKKAGITTELSTNGLMLPKVQDSILQAGIGMVRIAVDYFYKTPGYINRVRKFLAVSADYPETKVRVHTIQGNSLEEFKGLNPNAVLENKVFDNWVGAVDGESKLNKNNECYFIKYGYYVVLWTGEIVGCCMDWNGTGVCGNVLNDDEPPIHNPNCARCRLCPHMQFAEGGLWEKDDSLIVPQTANVSIPDEPIKAKSCKC